MIRQNGITENYYILCDFCHKRSSPEAPTVEETRRLAYGSRFRFVERTMAGIGQKTVRRKGYMCQQCKAQRQRDNLFSLREEGIKIYPED